MLVSAAADLMEGGNSIFLRGSSVNATVKLADISLNYHKNKSALFVVDSIVVEASSVLLECPFPCVVLCASLHSCFLLVVFFT